MGDVATKLPIRAIRTDGGTQVRAELSVSLVGDYAEKYKAGVAMDPIVVFYDGKEYWLADGFHRVSARRLDQAADINAIVLTGTRRDAILHAVGANETHGLRRSNEDKRRAVETLLRDDEWAKWSDRKIAEACRVHHQLVAKLRPVTGDSSSEKPTTRTFTTKHGTTATMNTANIGKRLANVAPVEPADDDDVEEDDGTLSDEDIAAGAPPDVPVFVPRLDSSLEGLDAGLETIPLIRALQEATERLRLLRGRGAALKRAEPHVIAFVGEVASLYPDLTQARGPHASPFTLIRGGRS